MKEGWMMIENSSNNQWKRRWCVLLEDGLYSFKDERKVAPKGVILLDDCYTARADQHTMKVNSFAIYHNKRKTWYLQPDDGTKQEAWCLALQSVVDGMAVDKENNRDNNRANKHNVVLRV